MTKEYYRFIHLSDIHFGQERDGTLVIHEDARQKLIEDCADFARDNGPADGILGHLRFRTRSAWVKFHAGTFLS
jgi:hypothetical protein